MNPSVETTAAATTTGSQTHETISHPTAIRKAAAHIYMRLLLGEQAINVYRTVRLDLQASDWKVRGGGETKSIAKVSPPAGTIMACSSGTISVCLS